MVCGWVINLVCWVIFWKYFVSLFGILGLKIEEVLTSSKAFPSTDYLCIFIHLCSSYWSHPWFFHEAIWYIQYVLGNIRILLTGCLASVFNNISCASADVLASFAFVIPKWFVSVWYGNLWEFYSLWCICWNWRVVWRLGEGWENFSQCFMWRVNACSCIDKYEFDLESIALKWCCSFCLMLCMCSFCLNHVELQRFHILNRSFEKRT